MPEPALPAAERDTATEDVIAPPASGTADKPQGDKALPDAALPATTAAPVEKSVESVKSVTQLPLAPVPVVNAPTPPVSTQSQVASSATTSAKPVLKIRFTFTEPTWVSVLDADNKEVLNKTGQPDSQEKIEVNPPAKLVIGNANGTHLEVNNKAIDLTPYNKLNVVRLTLE
jgi:cytoskeleton protein RodZ